MESKRIALLLLTLSVAACTSLRTKNQDTIFYVRGADSIQPECAEADYREAALACHRLFRGEHVVVGVREYSDLGLDRERFRKVTLVLENDIRVGDVIDISSEGVKLFYSTGLSFMPGKAGCFGEGKSGVVSILAMDEESLELQVTAQFDLKSPLDWPDACQVRDYNSKIVARRTSFERLGPWEGVKGEGHSLIAESVPDLYPRSKEP